MKRRFVLVDVFADRPFAGNPLAVFPESDGLSEADMLSIAREMDHASTAFLFPSESADAAFRLRIFSREREIPFAGYPALGAHFVHATEKGLSGNEPLLRVAHEGQDGLLEVEIKLDQGEIGLVRLRQRLSQIGTRLPAEEVGRLATALGLEEEQIQATNQPVKVVSTGLPVLIVPVSTLDALAGARPRYDRLSGILEDHTATILYAFTKETRASRCAAHARAFDAIGSFEIPATGAAAGALAAYLVSHTAVTVYPVTSLVIEQGHTLSRPSTLFAEVHVKDAKISQVFVGGRVIRVGEGAVEV